MYNYVSNLCGIEIDTPIKADTLADARESALKGDRF